MAILRALLVLAYPLLIYAALQRTSPRARESIVGAIARVQLGVLTPDEARYCRRVTWTWCAFFLGNAAIALGLARWGTIEAWAFYTGLVSYLLLAARFSAEYVYRQ
ncbi:MAG: hypothetical protein ACXW28_15525 [Thermoanaerobaculia bacterium]